MSVMLCRKRPVLRSIDIYGMIVSMNEKLSIDIVGLIGACSYALDCIEAELVNIKNKHGKRVAYISIRMAEYWKIQGDELQDLAMCALLHDNALTQYISEELKKDSVINCKKIYPGKPKSSLYLW